MSFVCATIDFLPEKPKPREGREWRTFKLSQLTIVEEAGDDDVRNEDEQYR